MSWLLGQFVGGPPTLDDTLIIPHGAGKDYCDKSSKLDGRNEYIPRKNKMKVALASVLAFSFLMAGFHASSPPPSLSQVSFPDLYEASVLELQEGLDNGHFISVDLIEV